MKTDQLPATNPSTLLLKLIAPILRDPGAHGHPDIPPLGRFVIEFDGYKGITDLIGGDLYQADSIDRRPLEFDQAKALLATEVPGHKHGRTSIGEIFDEIVEIHLAHRHPG